MNARDIVQALGGPTALGRRLGRTPCTIGHWISRDSFPPEYWGGIIAFAKDRDVPSVTLEVLAAHRAQKARPPVFPKVLRQA